MRQSTKLYSCETTYHHSDTLKYMFLFYFPQRNKATSMLEIHGEYSADREKTQRDFWEITMISFPKKK